MSARVRCHCRGNPECKLCHGTKFYSYQPGPRGWLPFQCPTCGGTGALAKAGGEREPCFTCQGAGTVDPANPPFAEGWGGIIHTMWNTFFGGG